MQLTNTGAKLQKSIKLYLDDERQCPLGWLHAKTASEAIAILDACIVDEISLDHDLGTAETGYDVLLWIEEQQYYGKTIPDIIRIHTANSSARVKMELAVVAINKRRNLSDRFSDEKNNRRNSD